MPNLDSWHRCGIGFVGSRALLIREQLNFLYAVFIPIISAFLLIRVIPIIIILFMSFTNYTIRRPAFKFLYLKNFARLFRDLEFIAAFWNSVEYVLVAVPLELCLGLLFALATLPQGKVRILV